MKKNFLSLIVISGLFLSGGGFVTVKLIHRRNVTANSKAVPKPTDVSVLTILAAHGGYNEREHSRYIQTATMTHYTNSSTGPQRVLDLKVKIAVDGSLVRYEKTTFNRQLSYWFDGQTVLRTVTEGGIAQKIKALDSHEAAIIKFQIVTFGLLSILKRLVSPRSQVSYVGSTSNGDKFQVTTVKGFWYFYTDSNHLINRLEVENMTITYGDYRTVGGLKLPFYQQVKKGDKLLYEIKLDTVELNPTFDADLFKHPSL